MINTDLLKPQLRAYLSAIGITPEADDFCCCPNPSHADHAPYENAKVTPTGEGVKCFVCQQPAWDVIAIEQMRTGADFLTAAKDVARIVGVDLGGVDTPAPSRLDKPKKEPVKLVSLPFEEAAKVFNQKDLLAMAAWFEKKLVEKYTAKHGKKPDELLGWGDKINGMWAARNEAGLVEVVDVRFEKVVSSPQDSGQGGHGNRTDDGKTQVTKTVISFYWDGQRIQSKGCPVVLFGRDLLAANPDAPVCFHEGAKCWNAAKTISGIVPLTWNRGVENVGNFDIEPTHGRRVYIYPDDDAPGRKAARKLAARLQGVAASVKICAPMVRGPGYDVVDTLAEGKTPDEIRAWILDGPELEEEEGAGKSDTGRNEHGGSQKVKGSDERLPETGGGDVGAGGGNREGNSNDGSGNSGVSAGHQKSSSREPFVILGIGDDRKAHFIDDSGRLQKESLKSITKPFLMTLTNQFYWMDNYTFSGKMSWDSAINDIIMLSKKTDFDADNVRGRGAWREKDGRICYHDGRTTYGEPDEKRLYVRKAVKSIGLDSEPAPASARRELLAAVSEMSFASKADTVRALSWAALAPFGGAMLWRPSVLLTGDSASGKSTLLNLVIVPLTEPIYVNGGESSAAGGRQTVQNDSTPFVIDEAEDDGKEGLQRRKGWFSLMRQATSDDAPQTLKGTPNGEGPISYTMRQMFLFAAISPDPGAIQDDNRIMPVRMVSRGDSLEKWLAIKSRVKAAVTSEVCNGIRAHTWLKLRGIIDDAERISDVIQATTTLDNRRAYADALLFSAFFQVWKDEIPSLETLKEFVATFYAQAPTAEKRNEAEEMIERIFAEVLPLNGDNRERHSVEYYLRAIHSGWVAGAGDGAIGGQRQLSERDILRMRETLFEGVGIGLIGDGGVGFRVSNPTLKKITGKDRYSLILERHKDLKRKTTTEGFGSFGGHRAVVILNLLEPPKEEAPF